jgi:hypothetical protein
MKASYYLPLKIWVTGKNAEQMWNVMITPIPNFYGYQQSLELFTARLYNPECWTMSMPRKVDGKWRREFYNSCASIIGVRRVRLFVRTNDKAGREEIDHWFEVKVGPGNLGSITKIQ